MLLRDHGRGKDKVLPWNSRFLQKERGRMDTMSKWNIIFVTVEFTVCLLGITFNTLVIYTISKNIYRLSPPTYLILSIAVSDFLSCSIALPLSIAKHLQKEWPFGVRGCRAHAFLISFLALVSIAHLAAISAGKYLTITRSLSRNSYFNKKKVMLIILFSWMYSLGFSLGPLVGWSRYGPEGTNATCSVQWRSYLPADQAYFGTVTVARYFLPLTVITFCYYKIHKVSRHIVVNTSRMGCLAVTATHALLKRHRKSAMYFLTIIAAFLIPWSPYVVVSFLLVSGINISPLTTSSCSVFARISFFVNPVLYTIFHRRFRRRLVRSVPITRQNRVVGPTGLPSTSRSLALWILQIGCSLLLALNSHWEISFSEGLRAKRSIIDVYQPVLIVQFTPLDVKKTDFYWLAFLYK